VQKVAVMILGHLMSCFGLSIKALEEMYVEVESSLLTCSMCMKCLA
jgi:hypothetical protein